MIEAKSNNCGCVARKASKETTSVSPKKIKTPAGLDLGAKLPEEVAISILAEIIKQFRLDSQVDASDIAMLESPNEDYYMNPVCNIPIQKSTAKHILEHAGEKVYFCCDGCKVSF